jgi:hypothetical protein
MSANKIYSENSLAYFLRAKNKQQIAEKKRGTEREREREREREDNFGVIFMGGSDTESEQTRNRR